MIIDESTLTKDSGKRKKTREKEPSKIERSHVSDKYYEKILSTTFDPKEVTDASNTEKQRLWRLKKLDTRTKFDEKNVRNLRNALNELNRIAEYLHLPSNIKKEAENIYVKAYEKNLIKGRTVSGFVAASLYAAIRKAKNPRSLIEVSKVSTVNIKTVSNNYRILLKELDIKMPIDYPIKFIPKLANEIKVKRSTETLAVEIIKKAEEKDILTGKDPKGIAAAALYLACKLNREDCTQSLISAAAGTSEVTLRKRLRDLEKIVNGYDLI